MLLGSTLLAIGPWPGFAWGAAAVLVAALAQWVVGRLAWRSVGRRIARHWAEPVSRRLASRRTSAVALLRLLPVAPFAVVNVVAGAIRVMESVATQVRHHNLITEWVFNFIVRK
jgi:uncharacterized membrane protein YdjX (TVP38/TMEM64 family)